MAAVAYTLLVPRTNFMPGAGGIPRSPNILMPDSTEAQLAGTRPPFVIDTTMWSTLTIRTPHPYRTVARQIQIIGSADWCCTHYSAEASLAAAFPVAATRTMTFELTQESLVIYVAALAGTSNLNVFVSR